MLERIRKYMEKRLLTLGCICTVAILIGVSFTSVVGYSSTKSNYVRASPLFNIRTKKAINDENRETTTCGYVGKGKDSVLHIPTLNEKIEFMIDKIKKMDSKSFDRLKLNLIKQIQYNDIIKNEDSNVIALLLNQIRNEPKEFTDNTDCTTKPFKIFCEIFKGFYIGLTIFIFGVLITFLLTLLVINTALDNCCTLFCGFHMTDIQEDTCMGDKPTCLWNTECSHICPP